MVSGHSWQDTVTCVSLVQLSCAKDVEFSSLTYNILVLQEMSKRAEFMITWTYSLHSIYISICKLSYYCDSGSDRLQKYCIVIVLVHTCIMYVCTCRCVHMYKGTKYVLLHVCLYRYLDAYTSYFPGINSYDVDSCRLVC